MRKVGKIQIADDQRSAKCNVCGKSLAYRKEIHPKQWTELLKVFIGKHRDCGELKTS